MTTRELSAQRFILRVYGHALNLTPARQQAYLHVPLAPARATTLAIAQRCNRSLNAEAHHLTYLWTFGLIRRIGDRPGPNGYRWQRS